MDNFANLSQATIAYTYLRIAAGEDPQDGLSVGSFRKLATNLQVLKLVCGKHPPRTAGWRRPAGWLVLVCEISAQIGDQL